MAQTFFKSRLFINKKVKDGQELFIDLFLKEA